LAQFLVIANIGNFDGRFFAQGEFTSDDDNERLERG
jgi:hypothetical protein